MKAETSLKIKNHLLTEASPETEGLWSIRSDEGLELTKVKGRYQDIVEFALTIPNFEGWGSGGSIRLLDDETVKTVPRGFSAESLKTLYARKKELEKELFFIEEKIRNLDVDYE